ncbi:MAG: hypothetical protein ABJ004_05650 [Cyclobacteriaceae bacterium]
MSSKKLFIGNSELHNQPDVVSGDFVRIENEEFYKISGYDRMRPFFVSLVSHSDHWLFISTTGGLSAGRTNANSALFPYYTDDKIEDLSDTIGSKTILRVSKDEKTYLWEPFSSRYEGAYNLHRNLYKNLTGNKIIFEEHNTDLNLTFRYSWMFSEKYGVIKKSSLLNGGADALEIEVLDGLQNIVPYGINSDLQNAYSNLANAYKKNELDEASGLGLFMLSAIIVDRAEPSEALKATTVWSAGLESDNMLLSSRQVNDFRLGKDVSGETDVRAERGAYFINATLQVGTEPQSWYMVAEVNQDHADVEKIRHALTEDKSELVHDLLADVEHGTQSLLHMVGKADGLQLTADKLSVSRHYSNVLFNIMRGGIFDDHYNVEKDDLLDYIQTINRGLAAAHTSFFAQFGENINYVDLLEQAQKTDNPDLIRVCYEYMPLTFSRRHGDPSRPWNRFSIVTKNEDGSKKRSYEGNWRDIFQNWEALSVSYPAYILSMITKFVNASTIDGYNPYRITRDGIDWEMIEPDDPWSYIGYWGDHQIIYLQKLMEVAMAHQPDDLRKLLSESNYVYANVPYRIKGYEDIVKDPKGSIDFDANLESIVQQRVVKVGADGKLVYDGENNLIRANLAEKLLVTLLAKLSNFVPEGGIWLNTQRPEWNDANNALVGNGVSMVTLYYMRRYVSFCIDLFSGSDHKSYKINSPVSELMQGIGVVFSSHKTLLNAAISNADRRKIVDALGKLGEQYRNTAYRGFNGQLAEIDEDELLQFFELALTYIDHTIKANKREDGLYHAYNLIEFSDGEARIDHLYEMLEGQVAVLSAGLLDLDEALAVLDALKQSKIYREDQYSYMLYPNRQLPRFLEKNTIPKDFVERSKLAQRLLVDGDASVLQKDIKGNYHFNGTFNNQASLINALDSLKNPELRELVDQERQSYVDVFESTFNHRAFTGRSGTFYGYEGLGSIYWHMVSKLLLATQENIYAAAEERKDDPAMGRMIDHYYEIRAGIGINKSPEVYGSFPTDPYSHTPGNKGVQQPGMTGQVKEDVLNRWAEFGVSVSDGNIIFAPIFLSSEEFLDEPKQFKFYNLEGSVQTLNLSAHQLAFTYCQVPVVYTKSDDSKIAITLSDGTVSEISGRVLTKEYASEIFNRTRVVVKVQVFQKFS